MEVTQVRETEPTDRVLAELFEDFDQVMQVDAAGPRVEFVVIGWFCFPKRSLLTWRGDQPT